MIVTHASLHFDRKRRNTGEGALVEAVRRNVIPHDYEGPIDDHSHNTHLQHNAQKSLLQMYGVVCLMAKPPRAKKRTCVSHHAIIARDFHPRNRNLTEQFKQKSSEKLNSPGLQNSLHFIQYISAKKTQSKMTEISQFHSKLPELFVRMDHCEEVKL
jgi:hypothetical protein